jgi:putative membrane protein
MSEQQGDNPPKIKPQMVFDEPSVEPEALDPVLEDIEYLQDKMVFGEDEAIQFEVQAAVKIDQSVEVEKAFTGTSRKWSLPGKLLAGFVSVILAVETVGFFSELWLNQPIIAALYTGAFTLIVGMGVKFGVNEYRHLKRLKKLQRWHNASQRMDSGEQIGEALRLCKHINKELPDNEVVNKALAQWQGALRDTFTDKDVMDLYSQTVLQQIDEQALKVVSRYASETSLMVAISPLAVVDMALVMWRSIKMIEQICALYGVKLGYWSRIKLIKTVLKNVVYAGVSELIADVGAAALSLELAGKLSARAAQGLGAGLLTGRLGFKVMQLCRPVPAPPDKQKRLSDLSKHLLGNIKRALLARKT